MTDTTGSMANISAGTPGAGANPGTAGGASGIRWLEPAEVSLTTGELGLLHCKVGSQLFRGVQAVRLFPVSHPERFISLHCIGDSDKPAEIGVIRDLRQFPPAAAGLIRAVLGRHYYEQAISDIFSVECEFGLLFFDVQTERGREQFIMRWQQDRAEDYGDGGKVLLDVFDNRFVIPEVSALNPVARRRLVKYIYW